jgi:hypothetical protein
VSPDWRRKDATQSVEAARVIIATALSAILDHRRPKSFPLLR